MTGPSTPTYAGSHGRGLAWKQGTVISVDGLIAQVRTTLTEQLPVRRDIMRAKGRMPEVGEVWLLDRQFGGPWTFAQIVVGGEHGNQVPQGEVTGLVPILDTLQAALYQFSPDYAMFGDKMASVPRCVVAAGTSVGVSGHGRLIGLGYTPVAQTFLGIRCWITTAGASGVLGLTLYHGPNGDMMNLQRVKFGTVAATSVGIKEYTFGSPWTSSAGDWLAIGLATSVANVAVQGILSSLVIDKRSAVFVNGVSAMPDTASMGPDSPNGSTNGRHWVALI